MSVEVFVTIILELLDTPEKVSSTNSLNYVQRDNVEANEKRFSSSFNNFNRMLIANYNVPEVCA